MNDDHVKRTAGPASTNRRGSLRLMGLALVLLGLSGRIDAGASWREGSGLGSQDPEAQARDDGTKAPVILLIGYEPFGKGRPPNPSWEGVKLLDGREWEGYQIVSKQARVVWGSPLEQVSGWAAEHRPVAVFAFGQGSPGSFTIETLAHNRRGKIKDNEDALPTRPDIVEGGPAEFVSTSDHAGILAGLEDRGYPVSLSDKAGRYLCEEMLYTLEYMKSTRAIEGDVLFCHMPPLGAKIGTTTMTGEYAQQFVEDLLESWHGLAPEACGAPPVQKSSATHPDEPAVRAMIERYFRTWSTQDMDGYDACFLPQATIQFIDPSGEVLTTPKTEFVAGQREYHRTARVRAVEVPTTVEVHFEQNLARVVVHWKLTAGPRKETGYDHFTLIKRGQDWKILNLVFYNSKE